MGTKKINRWLLPAGLIALSAVLLTFCQAPFDQAWMAWIAWVPFILACRPELRTGRLALLSYSIWAVYWLGNLYWLAPLTQPGYLIFGIVQALYAPLLAVCIRFIRQKQWPLMLFAPLIFVGAEAWQGWLFTGFSWYFLAHSQYQNLPLIQIADIFGQLGVSVLIAMVNGLIADLILRRPVKKIALIEVPVAALLLSAALLYGYRQLGASQRFQSQGPLVGSVQTNVLSEIKESADNGPELLAEMIEMSNQCFEAGALLTAWPETMVLAPMNPGYRMYLNEDTHALQYHDRIGEHASKHGGYVLFGSHAVDIGIINGRYDVKNQYNSAYLYNPEGKQDLDRYDKIHLVPFGEYIPFKKSVPWIYKIILALSPYEYDYNLTPGEKYTRFTISDNGHKYGFGVLICYEDTDPTVSRKLVLNENQPQKADFLVNLSNDGWYVFKKDGQMKPSVELAQRTAITVFRCIENRISIVRSVNTGISCLIDPNGKIRDGCKAGTLPEPAMERQAVPGWFVDNIILDSRVSFFTRHGRWPDLLLGLSLLIIFPVSLWNLSKKKKAESEL